MDKEELRQMMIELMQEMSMSSLTVPFHTHSITDAGQLDASKCLINTPQTKLTTATGGTLSSGGVTGLTNADNLILTNALTRIADIESKITTIGLIKSS